MPKAKTKTEEGGFAALSSDNKRWITELETKGWLFSFDAGTWSAKKGALDIGPFDAFMVMMNQAEREETGLAAVTQKVDTEANGQKRLPSMEAEVIPEIVELAKRRIEVVTEHKRLTQALVDINANAHNLAEKYPAAFIVDDLTGSKTYTGGGVELEIEHEVKDKVHARFVDDEPAAAIKKNGKKGK